MQTLVSLAGEQQLGQRNWRNIVRTLQDIPYKLFRIKRNTSFHQGIYCNLWKGCKHIQIRYVNNMGG